MKKKILILFLSSIMIFNNINFTYANENNKNKMAPILIAPEVYTVVIGALATTGVVLTLEETYSFIEKFYHKVDSGVFSTYSNYSDFEQDLLNNTKKQKDPDTKKEFFIISDEFVEKIKNIFDNSFSDNSDGSVIFKNAAFSDKTTYISTSGTTIIKNVMVSTKLNGTYVNSNLHFIPKFNSQSSTVSFTVESYVDGELYNSSYFSSTDLVRYKGFVLDSKNSAGSLCLETVSYCEYPYNKHTYIKSENISYKGSYDSSNISNSYVCDNVSNGGNIQFKPPIIIDEPTEDEEESNIDIPSFSDNPNFDFSSIQFERLGNLFENLKTKFPFSIPNDIFNIIKMFKVDPMPPIFEFEILNNNLIIDFTIFNEWANIVRIFVVLGWVFVLFTFTKKIGG